MAYPTNLIQDGETVALDLRPHWWYFSRNILTGIPLAIVFILMANHVDNSGVTAALWWIMIAVVLAWAGWLVIKYFQWTMTYFVVTSRRVINFHQRLIDRIIGAGDLDIESAGKDGQTHFDFVRHPDGVQHEIYRQMEVRNMPQGGFSAPTASAASVPPPAQAPAPGAGPATAAAAPAVSIPDQIEQLANLRDAGRITPDEYEQKKAELLDRM
jgi:hypothetical protein